MKGTAATIALGTALVLVGGGWTTGQPRGGPAPQETLALSNANLVDVRTGSVRPSVGGTEMAPSVPGAAPGAAGGAAGAPLTPRLGFQPLLRSASLASSSALRERPRSTKGTGTRVT